ncbi:MAG: DNA replication/repair protein RecF [Clostridia bacterium]|nr:DNA replication/repair protein RecF [Clostridia bacterium]
MHVTKLNLNNFRNYRELSLEFDSHLNIITGPNAQGKTNLLEGLVFASIGKSHRGRDEDLPTWGSDFFRISVDFFKQERDFKIEIRWQEKKKKILINGVQKKKIGELLGNLNTVLFAPEDLQMVKGGPGERRKFLDLEISQLNPTYYHDLQQFIKILSQRNNLLKQISQGFTSAAMLEIWDQQLVDWGAKIYFKRIEILKKFNPLARLMHRKITNGKETLEIQYISSVGQEKETQSNYQEVWRNLIEISRKEEIRKGFTIYGPHRDDLRFVVNNIDMRYFGSQGQQRTTALAVKLAELELVKSEIGHYPVLLLDDVMSELDDLRQKYLLQTIQEKIQTFITTTNDRFFEPLGYGKVFNIYQGEIKQ